MNRAIAATVIAGALVGLAVGASTVTATHQNCPDAIVTEAGSVDCGVYNPPTNLPDEVPIRPDAPVKGCSGPAQATASLHGNNPVRDSAATYYICISYDRAETGLWMESNPLPGLQTGTIGSNPPDTYCSDAPMLCTPDAPVP